MAAKIRPRPATAGSPAAAAMPISCSSRFCTDTDAKITADGRNTSSR